MDATEKSELNQETTSIGRRSQRRDIFLFSHPRTVSNLLCRLLSNQPGWSQSDYHFLKAFSFMRNSLHGTTPFPDMTPEQREAVDGLLQKSFDRLQQARDTAVAKDENVFIKNHVIHIWEPSGLSQSIWGGESAPPFPALPSSHHNGDGPASAQRTNPTVFTDEFLKSWLPIFLIRHPALVFDSWYRAERHSDHTNVFDQAWRIYTSFSYTRQLYDWFVANASTPAGPDEQQSVKVECSRPIVIDADDIIEQRSIEKLCELCDMDPSIIPHEWEKSTPPAEEMKNGLAEKLMKDFWSSTSIDKSKSSAGINMEEKYQKWKDDYGIEAAGKIYERVQEAMSDYDYLKSKKI
ncbi:Pyrrolopyrazine biosynthesis cluster protein F [Cladobotryum mycophilum]|uniref:Pyrrolopyrazine biosynthesis cluster protein F n=1 Tax=Cladobotryum mycophilum TaxID=491253 RepID=A0ABR0SV51_9HYPO